MMDELLDSERIVLMHFYSHQEEVCRLINHSLAELEQEYETHVRFVRVDVDASPEVARRYAIKEVPVLLAFKNRACLGSLLAGEFKAKLEYLCNVCESGEVLN